MKNLIAIAALVALLTSCASDNSPTPLHSVLRIDSSAQPNTAVAEEQIQFNTNVLSGVAAPSIPTVGGSAIGAPAPVGTGTGNTSTGTPGTATTARHATVRTPLPGASITGNGDA